MMDWESLLPSNSTQLERDLEEVITRSLWAIPIDINKIWRPDECPAALLPWLAWTFSVDEWDASWDEATKRAMIASSVYIHRHKGTVAAVKRAMDLAGAGDATLREWFEYGGIPRTFQLILPEDHPIITKDGQELLIKLVTAAKPVAAQMLGIIQAELTVATVPGDHWMPYIARYDDRRKLVFDIPLAVQSIIEMVQYIDCRQTALDPTAVFFPIPELKIDFLSFNQPLRKKIQEQNYTQVTRPRPEGEIEPGRLIVHAEAVDGLTIDGLIGSITQITVPPHELHGTTHESAHYFATNVKLREPIKTDVLIIQLPPPDGIIEPGRVIVEMSLETNTAQYDLFARSKPTRSPEITADNILNITQNVEILGEIAQSGIETLLEYKIPATQADYISFNQSLRQRIQPEFSLFSRPIPVVDREYIYPGGVYTEYHLPNLYSEVFTRSVNENKVTGGYAVNSSLTGDFYVNLELKQYQNTKEFNADLALEINSLTQIEQKAVGKDLSLDLPSTLTNAAFLIVGYAQ